MIGDKRQAPAHVRLPEPHALAGALVEQDEFGAVFSDS